MKKPTQESTPKEPTAPQPQTAWSALHPLAHSLHAHQPALHWAKAAPSPNWTVRWQAD
jgi:hypothetical protein